MFMPFLTLPIILLRQTNGCLKSSGGLLSFFLLVSGARTMHTIGTIIRILAIKDAFVSACIQPESTDVERSGLISCSERKHPACPLPTLGVDDHASRFVKGTHVPLECNSLLQHADEQGAITLTGGAWMRVPMGGLSPGAWRSQSSCYRAAERGAPPCPRYG